MKLCYDHNVASDCYITDPFFNKDFLFWALLGRSFKWLKKSAMISFQSFVLLQQSFMLLIIMYRNITTPRVQITVNTCLTREISNEKGVGFLNSGIYSEETKSYVVNFRLCHILNIFDR